MAAEAGVPAAVAGCIPAEVPAAGVGCIPAEVPAAGVPAAAVAAEVPRNSDRTSSRPVPDFRIYYKT